MIITTYQDSQSFGLITCHCTLDLRIIKTVTITTLSADQYLSHAAAAPQAFTAPQKGPNRLTTTQWQQLQGVLEWAAPTPPRLGSCLFSAANMTMFVLKALTQSSMSFYTFIPFCICCGQRFIWHRYKSSVDQLTENSSGCVILVCVPCVVCGLYSRKELDATGMRNRINAWLLDVFGSFVACRQHWETAA